MTSDVPIRVLYVTAGFPFPLSSGYLRHFHLLGQLAPSHRVHLMSLTGPSFRPRDVDGVQGIVERVSTFSRRTGRATRQVRLLDPTRPDAATRDLTEAVAAEIDRGAADVVVLSGKDTVPVTEVVRGRVPLVVDLCDAASARLTQQLPTASAARRAGLLVRRHGLRRVERRLMDAGDVLLAASARDRDILAHSGGPRAGEAIVVPNGIDLSHWHRRRSTLGDGVVFCGNLGYRPNADAARQLILEVMPHVWARHPEARATVIGTGASVALQAELDAPRVTLTGAVADVRPHLEDGAVFAAPLRIGSGIQNKLLEAMAMELPVVTTTVAAAGLVTNGVRPPVTVADDASVAGTAIADQLDQVLQGATEPRRANRAWVGERFRWDRSGQALAQAIAGVASQERASC